MGLFNRNKIEFDNIKFAGDFINIPKYEELRFMPLGEYKGRAIESKQETSNILHITKNQNDKDYIISSMLQIIDREESMIILDPNGKLYNRFKTLLYSKNYRIRYVNIDEEDSNTWNFFDNDELDINNPNAKFEVVNKCGYLLDIFYNQFFDTEEYKLHTDKWSIIFGAIYAYIYTNYLLLENKFERMYDLIQYNTVEDLDHLFIDANDITNSLWFDYDITDEEKDYYLSLSLTVIDLLREPGTNKIISTSDMVLSNPAKTKSAYFFDSIPGVLDDNNCINIILNFILLELENYIKETGLPKVPVYFIMNDIEYFPNLQSFINNSVKFENKHISLIYTCSELDGIYEAYDNIILNKFFNSLNYITIAKYDKENFDIINKHIINLPEGLNEEYLERKQILIAQDSVLLCKEFRLDEHKLYYRINFV